MPDHNTRLRVALTRTWIALTACIVTIVIRSFAPDTGVGRTAAAIATSTAAVLIMAAAEALRHTSSKRYRVDPSVFRWYIGEHVSVEVAASGGQPVSWIGSVTAIAARGATETDYDLVLSCAHGTPAVRTIPLESITKIRRVDADQIGASA